MKDLPSYLEEPKQKKVLDVYPLKKGKRVLLYLCDLVISFFLAFIVFTLIAVPTSKAIVGLDARTAASSKARRERNTVLVENGILNRRFDDDTLEESMIYSGEQFFRYYSDSEVSVTNPDIFKTFYFNVRDYESAYITNCMKSDVGHFFDYDEANNEITLKEVYYQEFNDGFKPGNKFTKKGQSDYNKAYSTFFYNMYGLMLKDIRRNDLTSTTDLRSYMTCQRVIDEYVEFFNNLATIDTYVSIILAFGIYFLAVPLFNKRHRTLSMMLMKVEKGDKSSLELLNKKTTCITFVYHLIMNLWMILFVPMMGVGVSAVFELPSILPVSIITFALMFISFVFILFDKYNRSISDFLTHTVCLDYSTLEDIYKARGYYI